MKRKILSIVVALALCLGMLPNTAGAAASPQTIYLNPSAGNDSNDGLSTDKPVLTLEKALGIAGNSGTIIIMEQVTLNASLTIENVNFQRAAGYTGKLFYISGTKEIPTTVTLRNVTVDGGGVDLNNLPSATAKVNGTLLYIAPWGNLILEEGAKLTNNPWPAVAAVLTEKELVSDIAKGEYVASLTIDGGEICNNASGFDILSGGVTLGYHAFLQMNSGSIHHNFAIHGGGGVSMTSLSNATYASGFTMTGGEIYQNTVRDPQNVGNNYGGGVYVAAMGSSFLMTGGDIYENRLEDSGFGGGVCVGGTGASFAMSGGTIRNNTITGTAASAGGGVLVDSPCTFTMTGGSITNNMADWYGGGIYNLGTFQMDAGTISGNTAIYDGGGIYNSNGTVTMNNGTISDNTANRHGGGIYNDKGTVQMGSGTISGNSAGKSGGGIYNYGTLQMNNGTISGNTATSYGGGIYNTGAFHITGGTVADNTCTSSPDIFAAGNSISLDGPSARIANLELYSNPSITVTASRAGAEPIRTHFFRDAATVGSVVAAYASGLTPDAGDFLCTNPGFMTVAQGNQVVLAASVTVTLDRQDGTQPEELTILSGTTLSKPASPVRDGYAFTGWFTDTACSTPYDCSAPVTEDLRLYAGWLSLYADYTAVDAALARVPADLDAYTEESAAALRAAVDAVVWNLSSAEQARVDGFAAAIEAALAGLVQKPAVEDPVEPPPVDPPFVFPDLPFPDFTAPSVPDVPDITPVTPDVPDTDVSLPVSTDSQNGASAMETTAVPPVAMQNGSAAVTVDAAIGGEIVRQAVEHGSETVVIAPEIPENVNEAAVTLPAGTVGELSSRTSASLTVATPAARVTIPNGGLGTLAAKEGEVTVAARKEGDIVALSVTADGEPVEQIPGGMTLTVPVKNVTPGTVAALVRTDGTREVIRKSAADGDAVVVPLEGSAVVEILDNSRPFSDVPSDSWMADAVSFVSARELLDGVAPDAFDPDGLMSRGMLAAALHNLEGNPALAGVRSFSDVAEGAWYASGVQWAAASGIVEGYSASRFGPEDPISRQQLAAILWRYAGRPAPSDPSLPFSDADQAEDWALDALRWAVEQGVMSGKGGGRLDPAGPATRAEAAQMLKNLLERRPDRKG